MQTISSKLLELLLPMNASEQTIKTIFTIFRSLKDYNESFLHLIIPSFCRMLNNSQNIENLPFLRAVIDYIKSILDFESSSLLADLVLQYTSTLVHALLQCHSDREDVAADCRDCIIQLVITFKEHAMIYLPLINKAFSKAPQRNPLLDRFKIISDKFKEAGDLEDIDVLEESNRRAMSGDAIAGVNPPASAQKDQTLRDGGGTEQALRNFNSELVKGLFDVSNNALKEDWEEWLSKTANQLIRNSPSNVLYSCRTFADVNPTICKALFNVSFAMIWSQFNDGQKCFVIQNIEKIIAGASKGTQNVPLSVLKMILNLAEFMEHDSQGLQLDIPSLAILAERCNAHAKALYYREFEFNFSPDESIESLIALYSALGQPEAAIGMLDFAKNVLCTRVKESWLEALGEWEEAFKGYSSFVPQFKEEFHQNMKDKIRCFDALTSWERVIETSEDLLAQNVDFGDVAQYAARASIQLGKWDHLEKYTEKMSSRKEDTNYFKSIISMSRKDYNSAKVAIKKSRRFLESFLVGLNRQTYQNNYPKLIRLQILSELEEIISYKEFIENITPDHNSSDNVEIMYSKARIEARKRNLLELWSDRIEGIEKNMSYWLEILSVRNLLFKKSEMMPIMLRFAQLALEKGMPNLCQRIFNELEDEMTKLDDAQVLFSVNPVGEHAKRIRLLQDSGTSLENFRKSSEAAQSVIASVGGSNSSNERSKYDLPPEFYLSKFEKMYKMQELNNEQIYDCIQDFFANISIPDQLKASYCRKLGTWLSEGSTKADNPTFKKVIDLFQVSLELDGTQVKTIHQCALTHYKRAKHLVQEQKKEAALHEKTKGTVPESLSPDLENLVIQAFVGFIKSISLGGPEFTETLQDTLKLLELWFKYGNIPKIRSVLLGSFEKIDILCWLSVVPQLITKLDIPNEEVLEDVLALLEYIGRQYPQSLIFQLNLAAQSKLERRHRSASKLISKLQKHHPVFVTQAHTISQELRNVAILFEEEWNEMINEVIQFAVDGKFDMVAKIMLDLHAKIRKPPGSQNEVLFYQRYGSILREAELILEQYLKYRDPNSMYQVFDIYIPISTALEENIKAIETVCETLDTDPLEERLSQAAEHQGQQGGHPWTVRPKQTSSLHFWIPRHFGTHQFEEKASKDENLRQ